MNIEVKGINVKSEGTTKNERNQNCSMKRSKKLIEVENRIEIVWVCTDIVTTSPFKIDIPASSKSIGFHT